jgi:predicted transcriptional regulator
MRYGKGADHPHVRVTEAEVKAMLLLLKERKELQYRLLRLSNKLLADKFDVSPTYIAKLSGGILWPHIVRP